MPIYNGLSTKNQAEIITGNKFMQKVYVGEKLVWQKIKIPPTIEELFPRPVAIVNEEINSFINGTPITITAIDTENHTITLSWLPPYSTIEIPFPGKNWIVGKGTEVTAEYIEPNLYGQDQAFVKILSGNRATKTLTYDATTTRKIELLTVGSQVYFYNIFNSGLDYNAGRPTALIPTVASTYYSVMTGTGAIWKHSDGTYRMALNGNDGTNWRIGLWQSSNLLDWTFINTTPLITISPGTWRQDGIQVNSIIKHGGGFIGYCWGQVGGFKNIGWVKFDENMENVTYSADNILPNLPAYGAYNPNVIYYNGEYKMLVSARLGADSDLVNTPWEVWECYATAPEGPFTKRNTILNSSDSIIRNQHNCYRSSHTTSFGQFIYNGKLCAWIDGTSMWNSASNRGEREFGLIYYDTSDSTWKDQQIGIIAASYQFADSIWNLPKGHLGGTPTMIKKDGKLYMYLATTQISDLYQTVLFTVDLPDENLFILPLEIDVPNKAVINTLPPTITGTLSIPGPSTSLATNLISVYEMNEESGTSITDSFGTNNGTIQTGWVINQPGLMGKCGQTDPSTRAGYISIPHNSAFNPHLGNFSINTWIKYSGDPLYSKIAGVLTKGDGLSGTEFELVLRGGGSADYNRGFYFRFSKDFTNENFGPSTDKTAIVGNGSWHMITLSIDMSAATKARVYLDGVEVGNKATVSSDVVNTYPVLIGRYGSSFPMLGFIDQTAFWNKALTTTEITLLYNSGAGLPFTNW